jgi:hypothetical protein
MREQTEELCAIAIADDKRAFSLIREPTQKLCHMQETLWGLTSDGNLLEREPKIRHQVKDNFFKEVFSSEESLRGLVELFSGVSPQELRQAGVKPVLFGIRENDLSFLCDEKLFYFFEIQSSENPNIPYRVLQYTTEGLERNLTKQDADRLYQNVRVRLPEPKLYVIYTGVKEHVSGDTERMEYVSDSYKTDPGDGSLRRNTDLEVAVHAYELRMSYQEMFDYLSDNRIPDRLAVYGNTDILNYALFANSLSYLHDAKNNVALSLPDKIRTVEDLIVLFENRGIFVELLEREEVYRMILTQYTYEDDIRADAFQKGNEHGIKLGMEKGIEKGIEKGMEQGIEKGIKKGIALEREQGVKTFIYSLGIFGASDEAIIQLLVKQYNLLEHQAREYLKKYR